MFFVIRNGYQLNVSEHLSGYHFYGTDLCVNARKMGKTCHVIDFPILHPSHGTLDQSFYNAKDDFESNLSTKGVNQIIKTTCTYLYAGNSLLKRLNANFLSWKMVKNHPNCKIARQCINLRGYKIIGPIWPIIIFMANFFEGLGIIKSTFHRYRRRLKKALFGEKKRSLTTDIR